jgi:hypothetical protein
MPRQKKVDAPEALRHAAFDLPDSFTIEFWFRQRSNQSFSQDLVYKGTSTDNYNFYIFRQLWNQFNDGPVIAGFTSNDTGFWKQVSNPNQLAHDVWHYVAYTKDANGHAYCLDGNLIHSRLVLVHIHDQVYTILSILKIIARFLTTITVLCLCANQCWR